MIAKPIDASAGDSPAARLDAIRARVAAAASRVGRASDSVRILAVSKTFPLPHIWSAIEHGQLYFGESRVQEAEPKIRATHARNPRIEWHMIGPLQRNKARRACELFDVVQSVDRASLAESLSRIAQARQRSLRVFLQINIDEEPSKAGVTPHEARQLLHDMAALPGLRIEGLMAIPRLHEDPEDMRPAFARLRTLAEDLRAEVPESAPLSELSMGMSDDFEIAIEEGATWIRVGSAIFGARENP